MSTYYKERVSFPYGQVGTTPHPQKQTNKEKKVKLSKEHKIEKALQKETGTRFQTEYAMLEDGNLVATNGRILAVVPVEVDDADTNGLVSKEALVQARKGISKGCLCAIGCNSGLHLERQGMTLDRPFQESADTFPSWKSVIPSADATVRKITINAKALHDLASALASDAVTLHLQEEDFRAILVTGDNDATGVIMPLSPAK